MSYEAISQVYEVHLLKEAYWNTFKYSPRSNPQDVRAKIARRLRELGIQFPPLRPK